MVFCFRSVREVHWFRNSMEGKCFLCIILDCVVAVWLCKGKLTNVRLEQELRIDIRTVAQGKVFLPAFSSSLYQSS